MAEQQHVVLKVEGKDMVFSFLQRWWAGLYRFYYGHEHSRIIQALVGGLALGAVIFSIGYFLMAFMRVG